MMKKLFFHLLSDNMTVKQISFEQYQRYAMALTKNVKKIALVSGDWIRFSHGRSRFCDVPIAQLNEILDVIVLESMNQ